MKTLFPAKAAMPGAVLLLGLMLGCAFFAGAPSPVSPPAESGDAAAQSAAPRERPAFGLQEALAAFLAEHLELETVDSLSRIATEHMQNGTLLQLPGIQREYRATSSPPSMETSLRLLDGAIAYNHILTAPPGTELSDEHRPRVRQLLELAGAEAWARLAAIREKLELANGGGSPELLQRQTELLLELRDATGFDADQLQSFDYSTLPTPQKLDTPLFELQRQAVMTRSETAPLAIPESFPEQIRRLYGNDPAAPALLAEALYRLPHKLAKLQLASPTRDLRDLAALGSAAGIVCEVELCRERLRAAWEDYESIVHRADDSPEMQTALAEALLQWRLAHFQLLAALGEGAIAGAGTAPVSSAPRPVDPGVIEELLKLLSREKGERIESSIGGYELSVDRFRN